ncbi:MAG: hypothetical protein AB4041_02975 [Microcystaceae cyanobacterium]
MSDLSYLEQAFLHTLIGDDSVYPWNPCDEQTEVFMSEQEKEWDFTQELTDSDIEERSANLFAQFKDLSSSTSDSECSQSNQLRLEQMGKELDNLAV